MNGQTTKYYKYENTSGKVNISDKIAKVLNWESGKEINMIIKTIDGVTGLFLFKKEKENKKLNPEDFIEIDEKDTPINKKE